MAMKTVISMLKTDLTKAYMLIYGEYFIIFVQNIYNKYLHSIYTYIVSQPDRNLYRNIIDSAKF